MWSAALRHFGAAVACKFAAARLVEESLESGAQSWGPDVGQDVAQTSKECTVHALEVWAILVSRLGLLTAADLHRC